MSRGNQHWVEELDFAVEEWTLDGVRLVEVLGRVHLLEMAHQAFVAAKQIRPAGRLHATPRRAGVARVAA